jgi:transposase
MVPIPDEADEDERRRVREREDLVAERVSLVNRIGAVLATLGVGDYNPLRRDPRERLEAIRTALGIRFRRTPAVEYFACSTAWNWCARRSPNWSGNATRCLRRRLRTRRR